MRAIIKKSEIRGTVAAPPSKSVAHRMLICAGLCKGEKCIIHGFYPCDDIRATAECLRALGAECRIGKDTATLVGCDVKDSRFPILNCGESGSTLRFFIPLCMLAGGGSFRGSDRLMQRPLGVYERIARDNGTEFTFKDNMLYVGGGLNRDVFDVDASLSGQFVSGLMFYAAAKGGKTVINLSGVSSFPYIEMTGETLRLFGLNVSASHDRITVEGDIKSPGEVFVEGDWSGAAFFEAFNYIGGNVTVTGLNENSLQGDRVFRDIVSAEKIEWDIKNCPDLAPVIMAVAACGRGAVLHGTSRLAVKESPRGRAMAEELLKLGISVDEGDDRITVYPGELHSPTVPLSGHNDHRIVMALSLLLTRVGGVIEGAECVKKSMPDFFEKLKSLGGEVVLDETYT